MDYFRNVCNFQFGKVCAKFADNQLKIAVTIVLTDTIERMIIFGLWGSQHEFLKLISFFTRPSVVVHSFQRKSVKR